MSSGKGKTFRFGKMLVNVSARGIATKDTDTGEIKRYAYPWAQQSSAGQPAAEQPGYQSEEEQYDEEYGEGYEQDYDDQNYDEPEYDEDGEYYAPEDDDDYDAAPAGILDAPWLMWAALILLPPLGIWLLWRNNRFEFVTRTVISVASLVWFVILLILGRY